MYDEADKRAAFDRTSGQCHICGTGMCYSNYGKLGERGAWEVEHSNPRAEGGTDTRGNRYGAHILCNREKGTHSTRTARSWHGRTRAPLSEQKRKEQRERNAVLGAGGGFLLALAAAATGGAALLLVGAGAAIGYSVDPEE